ncbi:MAG: iron chelate uptake ABC transporter family permease subunit [Clostridia bacterium]|nr:iron chelate uptake ABC transporter family permease subunit [Clostridia bacterium]
MAYIDKKRFYHLIMVMLIIVLILIVILSCTFGAAQNVDFITSVKILFSNMPLIGSFIKNAGIHPEYEIIVLNLRLPRILLAGLIGAGLSVSGAVFQGILKNPMADPYIIGVSSGAAFGATVAIYLGLNLTFLGFGAVSIMSFVGAIGATLVVYFISKVGNKVPVVTLLLAGVAVSSFLSALISFIMLFSREQVHNVIFWIMGSLSNARWNNVYIALPCIGIGIAILFCFAQDLNIMLLGDETASHLGVEVEKIKRILMIVASFVAASAVSVSGIIGFVGLIIPHAIRIIFGPDHRALLPLSALTGSIFLIVADNIARTIVQPIEIPVGVITALCGGPFFIYLLKKNKTAV